MHRRGENVVDVIQIVDTLASMGYIRPNRVINNYYSIYCPFHNNGQERKASFGILLEAEHRNGQTYPTGWCHCFTCGHVSTLPDMISKILESQKISKSGLDWLIENIPGFSPDAEFDYLVPQNLMESLSNTFAIEYINQQRNKSSISYVPEEELQRYRYTTPYMYTRKLTDDIISEYDIGVDLEWVPPGRKRPVPCITFPVRDREGRTLFLCRRSIEGKLYNYPTGVDKPLYGIDRIPENCKSLVICESCINALTARVYGYSAVALLGTGNALQMHQLKTLNLNEVVLCMDGDDAGRRAAKRIKHQLRSRFIVWVIPMPDGKDLNDLTKEEFDKLYSMRE